MRAFPSFSSSSSAPSTTTTSTTTTSTTKRFWRQNRIGRKTFPIFSTFLGEISPQKPLSAFLWSFAKTKSAKTKIEYEEHLGTFRPIENYRVVFLSI